MGRRLLLAMFPTILLAWTVSIYGSSRGTASSDEDGIRLFKETAPAVPSSHGDGIFNRTVSEDVRIEYLPLPTPEHAKILEVLGSRAAFRYDQVTLRRFVDDFAEAAGIDVVLDRRELEDFGIFADEERVSLDLKSAPVDEALDFVLHQLELTYQIEGDTLMITSQQSAEDLLYFRLYPVRDLIEQPGGAVDGNWLVHLITTHVEIDSWEPVGPGTITVYPQAYVIAVNTTDSIHERVLSVLRMLRQARKISGVGGTENRFFPSAAKRSPSMSLPVR